MTTDVNFSLVARSVAFFIVAGLCEIGGGYLVWRWWREGAGWSVGVVGAAILVLYGIIPTLQYAPFGRVYAAYGGVFVAMSLAWAYALDGFVPDRFDLIGACLCVTGVGVIMYAPR